MFLADIDLTKFGPWYGDLGSDIDDFIRSIKRVAEFSCESFVVSHEHPLYKKNIRKEAEAYIAVINEREDKLRKFLSEPRTLDEIVNARIIYRKPREPKSFFDFGEWALMTKHLDRMIKNGEVIEDSGKYRLAK
jgi:glyoxylase-like metal-dependent hydrolase (beta-lactamase superfamily II)